MQGVWVGGLLVFPLGEAKQRKLYTSDDKKDTPGTPLRIHLSWLECPYNLISML